MVDIPIDPKLFFGGIVAIVAIIQLYSAIDGWRNGYTIGGTHSPIETVTRKFKPKRFYFGFIVDLFSGVALVLLVFYTLFFWEHARKWYQ